MKRLISVPTAMLLATWTLPGITAEIDGFTEPYRTVEVAAPEMGIVTAIQFRVGDRIRQGQVIATLDDDIHVLLVESAEARKAARGRLASAQAEEQLRATRLAKLEKVLAKGHGRKEEVERAKADLEIAASNVIVAKDDILLRTLEHRKLLKDLERRQVRSPIDGFVVENLKEVGEFVAPNDPRIMKIVQLDPLMAKFSLRRSRAEQMQLGQTVKVSFANLPKPVEGIVEEISPVIDAESGTIRVKIRVNNEAGKLRSGQRCLLQMADFMEDQADRLTSGPSRSRLIDDRYRTKTISNEDAEREQYPPAQ